VFKALKEGLLADRAKTKAFPISPLGLVEMTRQREQESLRSTVFSPCPYCNGRGIIKSATSVSVEVQRRLQEILRRQKRRLQVRVTVHPQILERLKNEDADLLVSMEEQFGGELSFRAEPSLHREEFRIVNLLTGDEL
jgi:ribonuclease G